MTDLPGPYLRAAAARAHTDELIRQANRYRARRGTAVTQPRRAPQWSALLATIRRVRRLVSTRPTRDANSAAGSSSTPSEAG
jgi:hypothetical protein